MSNERAAFWLAVIVLLGIGSLLGQTSIMMIAAMAAIMLAYQNDRISLP
jgi:hypothetical protein